MSIILRGSSRQVGVKVGGGVEDEASWIAAIAAKISGFIPGEGSKTFFKACIVTASPRGAQLIPTNLIHPPPNLIWKSTPSILPVQM